MNTAAYERLMKLFVMGASDHDSKFINAARAADKLLRQHKLTWRDLLSSNGCSYTGADRVVRLELNLECETSKALRKALEVERRENGVFTLIMREVRGLTGGSPL
jgi:hypothetical protein